MVIKTGCQCFTCRHADEPRLLVAYNQGYIDACDWFLNWVKRHKIKSGSISEDTLPGIIAQIEYNKMAASCYLNSKDLPNIESE